MNMKKITSYICMVMVSASMANPVYAEAPPYKLPDYTEKAVEVEAIELTVESAVEYGLENNTNIKMLDNKISLALITKKNAKDNVEDLEEADEKLEEASDTLQSKQKELNKAQTDIDTAKSMLGAGIAPTSVPLVDGSGNPINDAEGNQIILSPGTNIVSALVSLGIPEITANAMADAIKANIRSGLDDMQGTIDENSLALDEARLTLALKENEFNNVLKDTSEKIDMKINYNSIVKLNIDDASDLMITMAGVNLDVTRYAKDIYRNQIAMLIQKNYYDALYAEKILRVKKVAEERGEKQYNIVKLSYENGMKAKDDLLLSKMYYDSTVISSKLAEATYKNAITELKMNMNMDLDTEITLQDSLIDDVSVESLELGLKSGLTNRIEIQQTLGQLMIYELNEEILASMYKGREKADACKEAVLLREAADLELEKTKAKVKSEIMQSYELMNATGEMLTASSELLSNAEEVVKIAELKYEQGLGVENALLKGLNLQDSSGTILELIAAQENLANIESQVANLKYSYTMAKVKYLNDSGILIY